MITADLIIADLPATSKKQAFQTLAEQTAPLIHGSPKEILEALLDRERLGSTGIGCGVAVPHIKLGKIEKTYGVLARLSVPVDYDAVDGAPVDIIFMLLAPADSKTTQHLKTLAQVSRFLRDSGTCNCIRGTTEHDRIAALLLEWAKTQAA